ncbi:hypothetical protein FUAX_32690 [Fulvitalea axinellae]|uniref:Uncharacterized protein n=1 Tax=Fulvitalea axinellae TaxID=1182444 RepID=A0AAU9CZE2_9BACT|nr:hypothetical protein FUAX_32690 [Fulvitalea axinellae]
MKTTELINKYDKSKGLSENDFSMILESNRENTVKELRKKPNREFALDLLAFVIENRQKENYNIGDGENIMFASYLVGLHKHVEDCLVIWKAKTIDFDASCLVDIQLVVFAGVDITLKYLKNLKSDDNSEELFKYIQDCKEAGDFDEIDEYFSNENIPWWV